MNAEKMILTKICSRNTLLAPYKNCPAVYQFLHWLMNEKLIFDEAFYGKLIFDEKHFMGSNPLMSIDTKARDARGISRKA